MADWQQAAAPWQRALKAGSRGDPRMEEYRWMLEELRVSLSLPFRFITGNRPARAWEIFSWARRLSRVRLAFRNFSS